MNATRRHKLQTLLNSKDGALHAQVSMQQRTAPTHALYSVTNVKSQDIWLGVASNPAPSLYQNAQDKCRRTIGRRAPADKSWLMRMPTQ